MSPQYAEGPAAVYRLYDTDDVLLYVGMSNDPPRRWSGHVNEGKTWWADVARKTVEWYESQDDALTVEAEAIWAEHPLHNTAPMPRREGPLPTPIDDPTDGPTYQVAPPFQVSDEGDRLGLGVTQEMADRLAALDEYYDQACATSKDRGFIIPLVRPRSAGGDPTYR